MKDLIRKEYCQLANDCNNYDLYKMFEDHTGIKIEFEIGQEYGTGCYGVVYFVESSSRWDSYPTLEKLEEKFEKYKTNKIHRLNDHIGVDDVVNYFRRKGIFPEIDFLFNVDY